MKIRLGIFTTAFVLMVSHLVCSAYGSDSVFYSTSFTKSSGWTADLTPAWGIGGTIETSNPFVVNGTTMSSYFNSTYYAQTLLSQQPSASTTPDVWLGFLLRNEGSGSPWLGGVNVFFGDLSQSIQVGMNAGTFGYNPVMSISGNLWSDWAPNTYQLTNGNAIAVLCHFYDTNTSGTYNTADLWVQSDLSAPLFQNLSSSNAVDYAFSLANSTGNTSISSLRLAGQGSASQSYGNLILSSSSNSAIQFLSTGVAVPEPSSALLGGFGGFGLVLILRWKKLFPLSK